MQKTKIDDYKSFSFEKKAALAAVMKNGNNLKYFPEFQADPQVVYPAVAEDWNALKYAPQLNNDLKIVERAYRKDKDALQHASPLLQQNSHLVKMFAIKPERARREWQAIQDEIAEKKATADKMIDQVVENVTKDVSSDKAPLMELVKTYPFELKSLDIEWQHDLDVVETAFKADGASMAAAPASMRAIPRLVLTALSNHTLAMRYSEVDQEDWKKVYLAIGKDLRLATGMGKKYEDVLKQFNTQPAMFPSLPEELRREPKLVLYYLAATGGNQCASSYSLVDEKGWAAVLDKFEAQNPPTAQVQEVTRESKVKPKIKHTPIEWNI